MTSPMNILKHEAVFLNLWVPNPNLVREKIWWICSLLTATTLISTLQKLSFCKCINLYWHCSDVFSTLMLHNMKQITDYQVCQPLKKNYGNSKKIHTFYAPQLLCGWQHILSFRNSSQNTQNFKSTIPLRLTLDTRVGTLIMATIYLQLIQNKYMFRSFTFLQCSHQHCVQPVASDVEVLGYL